MHKIAFSTCFNVICAGFIVGLRSDTVHQIRTYSLLSIAFVVCLLTAVFSVGPKVGTTQLWSVLAISDHYFVAFCVGSTAAVGVCVVQ